MTNTDTFKVLEIPAILTVKEAADLSRFAERTLRAAITQGSLRAGHPTGSDTRILGTDLVAWIKTSRSIKWNSQEWKHCPLHLIAGTLLDLTDCNPEDEGNPWIDAKQVVSLKVEDDCHRLEMVLRHDTPSPAIGSILQIPVEGLGRWQQMRVEVLATLDWLSPLVLCRIIIDEEDAEKLAGMLVHHTQALDWQEFDHQVRMSQDTNFTGPYLATKFLGISEPTSAHYREISDRMDRLGFSSKRSKVGKIYFHARPGTPNKGTLTSKVLKSLGF